MRRSVPLTLTYFLRPVLAAIGLPCPIQDDTVPLFHSVGLSVLCQLLRSSPTLGGESDDMRLQCAQTMWYGRGRVEVGGGPGSLLKASAPDDNPLQIAADGFASGEVARSISFLL